MKLIRNEKGIALVMVLVFSLIGLAIVSAMLFMLMQGTKMSGAFKLYKSADEAGLGGTIEVTDMIRNRGTIPLGVTMLSLPLGPAGTGAGQDACLLQKLTTARCANPPCNTATLWTSCGTNPATDPRLVMDPTVSPDMTVVLPGPLGTSFMTYTKIVDTVQGNSETSALVTTGGQLGGQGVVAATSGQVSPPSIPYMYKIEVQTQNTANPTEKSRYSVLYAY
jgi:hypothetical protein